MTTMTSLFVSMNVVDGVVVEYISRGFATVNPAMYTQIAIMGGFAAIKLTAPTINVPGSEHNDQQIVVLNEFREILTPLEFDARMEHELTHIRNRDMDHNPNPKKKVYVDLQMEMIADKAAADKFGPQVVKSAIIKSQLHQTKVLTKISNEKIAGFLARITRTKVMKKRIQALDAMM